MVQNTDKKFLNIITRYEIPPTRESFGTAIRKEHIVFLLESQRELRELPVLLKSYPDSKFSNPLTPRMDFEDDFIDHDYHPSQSLASLGLYIFTFLVFVLGVTFAALSLKFEGIQNFLSLTALDSTTIAFLATVVSALLVLLLMWLFLSARIKSKISV